jgi:hypothetical protein
MIRRSQLIQLVASASIIPSTGVQVIDSRAVSDCIDMRNVRTSLKLGPRDFGILEGSSVLLMREKDAHTRRYDMPRPTKDQIGWTTHLRSLAPMKNSPYDNADTPDEIVAITGAYGGIPVWLSHAATGIAYLTRFYSDEEVFQTNLLEKDDVITFYILRDIYVIRRDMTQIHIPW